jgi:transcriptional regulator with PAS, ATPase and Fis domain
LHLSRLMMQPFLVASAPPMQAVLTKAQRVAAGNTKVLITGESGVGKDLVARYIHSHSPRSQAPFVALNCAGLSEALLESELFGHVRGSFTGAHRDKNGRLQLANRGTAFLDEIGEMSPRMQALLLRFLENGEIQKVGCDSIATRADVRIIAATHRDLRKMVREGHFREDLLYRLKVVHLHIPPLRERRDDIPALVGHALERSGASCGITEAAMGVLKKYSWPGNVRELQNVIEQVISIAGDQPVTIDDLPTSVLSAVTNEITRSRDRRRHLSDDLYESLVSGSHDFWNYVQTLFINREITRHDVRAVIRRGLATTGGSYRALLPLFRIERHDYKRFLNFLAAHDLRVDYRDFRPGGASYKAPATMTHHASAAPAPWQQTN